MARVKIELNREGVRELLKSGEMEEGLLEITQGIASRCGEGYGCDTKQMGTRVISSVFTDSPGAISDNSRNNTILGALQ